MYSKVYFCIQRGKIRLSSYVIFIFFFVSFRIVKSIEPILAHWYSLLSLMSCQSFHAGNGQYQTNITYISLRAEPNPLIVLSTHHTNDGRKLGLIGARLCGNVYCNDGTSKNLMNKDEGK